VADPEERSTTEDTKGKVEPTVMGEEGIGTTGAGGGGGEGDIERSFTASL
jgi:hypothetical protein